MTRAEIKERLQEIGEEMISASFARDDHRYYELFEERGELLHNLRQLKSEAGDLGRQR